MARHTIQIPITKSSNSDARIHDPGIPGVFFPGPTTNTLYMQHVYHYEPHYVNIGLAWELPEGLKQKVIVGITVHVYSKYRHNYAIKYQGMNFIEGGEIPNVTSEDGTISSGFYSGWNQIVISRNIGTSIVLEQVDRLSAHNNEWAELYSHRNATNKPYVVITYDDAPPSPPTMLSPNNIEVNRKETIRFSWRHNSNEGYHQKGYTLQYSTNNGATWTTVTRTTSSQYYDLPANTFTTSGTILWRVKTVDGNDEESNYSNTATFDVKTPPNPPTNLAPNNVALNPKNQIRFSWKHNSIEGLTQKGFTLEYSTDDGSNWTTVNQTTNNQYYDLPVNKLPLVGTVQWRVRTVDGNDLTSGYGTASFTLKTPPDNPTSLYPNNITLNPREVIRFSWLHNSNSGLAQKDFTLQYSINGGSTWVTIEEVTSNQYYDMPAYTLPTEGTVLWRIKTTDGNGEVSGYTNASFTLGTPPQQAPIPIQPIGAYLDSTEPILFEWHFMGGTPGETQSKFDLEYSINGGSTWTTISQVTANKSKELPANTFNITGNITWRVRTYNNFDEVSPYSDNKTFYVISSPPIPQITDVSNNARPTIKWTSQGQRIYQLQILMNDEVIIDTGSVPSVSDREYKLKEYLKDGNYKVRLRVTNEYNLNSPWAEKSFSISTVKPQKPNIAVYGGEYSVTIKGDNIGSRNLVYRDNIYIGELSGNTFIDFTGVDNVEHKYFIRTVDSNDNFNDSDIKIAKCKFNGNTLALANNPGDFVRLKYGSDSIPRKNNSISTSGSLIYYDGRKYPIVELTEFKSKTKTVTFTLRTKEELNKLTELISNGKTLLFRDSDGENIYGNIFDLDYSKNILGFYEVGFTITKTDYKGVQYD